MFSAKPSKTKKIIFASILIIFLLTQSGILFYAKPARGQMDAAITAVETAEEIERHIKEATERAMREITGSFGMALYTALLNAVQHFFQKIAYDTAVWAASGFQGQRPMLFTQNWDTYLVDAGLSAAGEFIGTLSEQWTAEKKYCESDQVNVVGDQLCTRDAECAHLGKILDPALKDKEHPEGKMRDRKCIGGVTGISQLLGEKAVSILGISGLCTPPDPRLRLNIALALFEETKPSPPKCEWSNIVQQWDTFISEATTPEVLNRVGLQFQPGGGSDLDTIFNLQTILSDWRAKHETAAEKEREEGQGFKPLKEWIAGDIKTPSQVVREHIETELKGKDLTQANIQQATQSAVQGLTGQVMLAQLNQLWISVLSSFVDTLTAKLMDRVLKIGLVTLKDISKLFPKEDILGSPEFAGIGGRRVAEATYADLITPRIQEMAGYSPLVELSACPLGAAKTSENCAIDTQFVQAINQAATGDPLTVRQAIEKNFLHGEWPLIPESDPRNAQPTCYQIGYCYSNLVKLRKYRIIPIGWEIAANLIGTNDRAPAGTTLKQVVDAFEDCNEEGRADVNHPFCHLIDPNWLLKAPSHQCRAKVFGAVSIEGMRQETCVDVPTCLAEDALGNCIGGYGYCVREKNVWSLPGDRCDAQFDSCRALRSRTGEAQSFLINTVDYGPPCTPDDVGCRWYSTRQAKVGDEWRWQDTTTGSGATARKTDRIYFNKNVTQCDEPGCTEFRKTTKETSLNLLKNSSFENYVGEVKVDDDTLPAETIADWLSSIGAGAPVASGQAVSDAYQGSRAIKLRGDIVQIVDTGLPLAYRTFTLSFTLKIVIETQLFLKRKGPLII